MSTFYENDVEGFALRLKEAIGHESVHAFGKRAGLSDTSMRQYLAGGTPGIDKASAIAKAAGVNIEWLVNGTGEKFRGFKAKPQAEFETLPSNINEIKSITPEIVAKSMQALKSYIDENKLEVDAQVFGEVAALLCDMAAASGGFNQALIERIMRITKSH